MYNIQCKASIKNKDKNEIKFGKFSTTYILYLNANFYMNPRDIMNKMNSGITSEDLKTRSIFPRKY